MNKFDEHYRGILSGISEDLMSKNIKLVFVGGVVRDFIHLSFFSKDIDIELVSTTEQGPSDVLKIVESVLVKNNIKKIEKLPFNIMRFNINEYEIEFSIGRTESFIENEVGHKNFEPTYIVNDDYNLKWKRRDLSINAIGYDFDQKVLLDPYDGITDLRTKVLRPLNDDFYRDPVRLLRLIRFKIKMGFNYVDNIRFSEFNLKNVSYYYLFKEGERVKLSEFFYELILLGGESLHSGQRNIMEFAKDHEFVDFEEMVFKAIKHNDEKVLKEIERAGLFSKKKVRRLKKFFSETDREKKMELLVDIQQINFKFFKLAHNELNDG